MPGLIVLPRRDIQEKSPPTDFLSLSSAVVGRHPERIENPCISSLLVPLPVHVLICASDLSLQLRTDSKD
jgi:hypothetical protein